MVVPQKSPKQQHYVQRAYLDGFVDPDCKTRGEPYLWAYLPGKLPFRQKTERIAKRNYYYCFDRENRRQFDVEHTIQQLEDVSVPVLRKLCCQQFDINPEERLTFAGYVALSHTRVPKFEQLVNRSTLLRSAFELERFASDIESLKELARQESESAGKEITPEEMRRRLTGGNTFLTQTNRGWSLGQMAQAMMSFQKVVFEMCWTFLIAPGDDPGFITSDNPVSLLGGAAVGAYLTFPLSRGLCLLAKGRPGPPQTIVRVNAARVREVNKGTIAHADT
jgi:hypothetical protein